jgi:hypothetical protein
MRLAMSAFGTKRTSNCCLPMSAFGGEADIGLTRENVPAAFGSSDGRLASHSADAPTGGAAGVSSHASTAHVVHSCPACFADSSDHLIRLLKRRDGHGLSQRRQCQSKGNGDQLGHFRSPSCCPS